MSPGRSSQQHWDWPGSACAPRSAAPSRRGEHQVASRVPPSLEPQALGRSRDGSVSLPGLLSLSTHPHLPSPPPHSNGSPAPLCNGRQGPESTLHKPHGLWLSFGGFPDSPAAYRLTPPQPPCFPSGLTCACGCNCPKIMSPHLSPAFQPQLPHHV